MLDRLQLIGDTVLVRATTPTAESMRESGLKADVTDQAF